MFLRARNLRGSVTEVTGPGQVCRHSGRESSLLVEWLRKGMHGQSRQRVLGLGDRLWHFLFPLSRALIPGSSPAGASSFGSQLQHELLGEVPPKPHHLKVPPSQRLSDLFSSQPSAHLKWAFVYFPTCYLPVKCEPLGNRALASSSSAKSCA